MSHLQHLAEYYNLQTIAAPNNKLVAVVEYSKNGFKSRQLVEIKNRVHLMQIIGA